MTMSKRAQDEVYFTPQQIEWLRKTFPAPTVVPGACREQLMFAAGAASVVDACCKRRMDMRRVPV